MKFAVYFIALVVVLCGVFYILNQETKITIGSDADSQKKFNSVNLLFEGNQAKAGLAKMDSIFYSLSQPTAFDKIWRYNSYSYYANWDNLFYSQIAYADSGIQLAKKHHIEKELASSLVGSYTNKANGYYSLQNIEAGNEAFFEAFRISEKYGTNDTKKIVAYDIAMRMYQLEKFDTAAIYFKYAYQYNLINDVEPAHRNNKTQELLDNIGLCYTKLHKTDSALLYYNKCLSFLQNESNLLAIDSINNSMRRSSALGVVFGNMAKVYVYEGNIDTAIFLYNKAIRYNNFLYGDINDVQACMMQLAPLYVAQKNGVALKNLIEELKKTFSVVSSLKVRAAAEKMQYDYYLLIQKPIKALKRLQTYNLLKDSLAIKEASINKQDIIKELKDREQQLQINLLFKDNQLSKTYNWAFAIFSILVVSGLFLVYRFYKKEKKNVLLQAQLNEEILIQKKEIENVAFELEKLNQQKEKYMNIMAHELRSPISGVVAVAHTLAQSQDLQEQERDLVQMIEQTSANTLALINDLLSEKDSHQIILNKSQTNLSQLINKTIALLQYKATEKGQQIIVEYANEDALISIDADKIERVLINLITNAIKFSLPQKQIFVETQWQKNIVNIKVQDEGVGMNATQLNNLFNEHTTIKRTGTIGEKSFGFGLAICKQIVESHKGSLLVESKENQGSIFTIQLPV